MIKHSKHYDEKDRNVDCNNSGEWHKMRGFVSTDKQDDSTINPKMLIPKEDLVKGYMHCSNPTIENILEDRGNTYGEFNGQAILSQGFKDNATKCDKWRTMHSNKKEALEMIMSKMARIINGDPNYKDSWTDIIGYAKLIEKDL